MSGTFSFTNVTITQVLVQTLPPGENISGATLPVSQLEQGGARRQLSSSKK